MIFKHIIAISVLLLIACDCMASGIIAKLTNKNQLVQKTAIAEVFHHPKKYKSEISSYLSKKRNWENEKEWPAESVLYTVGVIRDVEYFSVLLKYLRHEKYCNDLSMEYGSAYRFAMTLLTSRDRLKHVANMPETDAKKYVIQDVEDFLNADKKSNEERRKILADQIKQSGREFRERYETIKNRKLEDLVKMAGNSEYSSEERFCYINVFANLVTERKYLIDLLILAIQGPAGGANDFKALCQYGIMNILIANGENKK